MPFPSLAFLEQLTEPLITILKKYSAALNAWLQVQHKDDGSHGAMTGDSLAVTGNVTASGTGPHTFGGDVIAEFGTGTETGIGQLFTVRGSSFLAGYPLRHGILMGGVTNGHFLVSKAKGGAFGGAGVYGIGIFDLANAPATAPMLEMALDLGVYAIIDGGTGSTRIKVGSSTRPMLAMYADSFIDTNGTHGKWIVPTVTDSNFRGSATGDADWVVNVPGDVSTFQYMMIGKTMFVIGEILTSDVANAPVSLIADIPGGFTCNKLVDAFCRITDAGVRTTGSVQCTAGGTTMVITRVDAVAFTNTGGAGNTAIRWEMFFEVQ